MEKFSYLKSINADYIDELFARYQNDPNSVDPTWRYFFEGIELGEAQAQELVLETQTKGHTLHTGNGNGASYASVTPIHSAPTAPSVTAAIPNSELNVVKLIFAYRLHGKVLASLDPLSKPASSDPELELSRFGLGTQDLTQKFNAGHLIGLGQATLSAIIEKLKQIYCGTIATELEHIENHLEKDWVQSKIESGHFTASLDPETRKFILKRLTETECFERFLHTRYVAQKRFSIEGADAVIPGLDSLIERGAELGCEEFIIGMAHRGRLNVLTNLLKKPTEVMFTEFEGTYKLDLSIGEGDVKYHQGYSTDRKTKSGKTVHLSLTSNPSHLEFVNPVVEGIARAKQTLTGDTERKKVVPILIHGDAAFAGQGVCYETLNFSQLQGYSTGGTIHIILNNQVGFTTNPTDSRSTRYCTDVMKMLEVPIFHVNGDDPESLWKVMNLAIEYRQRFRKDVMIDLVCYRRYGHNEGDEPSFTQPLMYQLIKSHPTPREVYARTLTGLGVSTEAEAQALVEEKNNFFIETQAKNKANPVQPSISVFDRRWKNFIRPTEADLFKTTDTRASAEKLLQFSETLNKTPQGFTLHPKLARLFEARHKAVLDGKGIDWGNAELLAYATLLDEGHVVRLVGQDVERGTFSHRHAVVNDYSNGKPYLALNHLRPNQAFCQIHNSLLSESAAMGFEYGYSIADPNALVIWEAQFGDFANGAQVIIDQFVSTAETKWQRMTGLVLLLPHSYEGQGPEHSSARLERFLQLCGRFNLTIANLTTPAQIFHALRRQVLRNFRKPLVVMSPKSLLRHPLAVSNLEDFTERSFEEVLDDPLTPRDAERVVLCTGKVYYDLVQEREAQQKTSSVALIRVEQLYPWPHQKLAAILKQYPKAKDILWAQEEPRNMGAWTYVFNFWAGGLGNFHTQVGGRMIRYAGRDIAASPAVGSPKIHEKEQKALVDFALNG